MLFIDEIHRLSPVVEEILYPALEDFQIDIMIGEGPAARSIKLDLPPFTLVGATTRAGMLTNPLRDRFGIVARLEFYSAEELATIVRRSAQLLNVEIDDRRRERNRAALARHAAHRQPAAAAGARLRRRSRPTARSPARSPTPRWRCSMWTRSASTCMDRKLLLAVIEKFAGGPVGLDNLAHVDRRGARHHRGRARALPDPVRLPAAHAARAHRDAGRLPPFRHRGARPARRICCHPATHRATCEALEAVSHGRCGSTTRTPTAAAWSTTPTT